MAALAAPRVVIVMRDQWHRALLRAALREAGYDAIGVRDGAEALLVRSDVSNRGPVRLLVEDHDSVTAKAAAALRERFRGAPAMLLARATVPPLEGNWDRVLRRPFSIEDVISAVHELGLLPIDQRRSIDDDEPED